MFANGLGDQGSIVGQIIPKTFKKWYLIPPCLILSIIRYVSRVKWSNPGKGVAPSPSPQLLKGETLGLQLYLVGTLEGIKKLHLNF